LRERISAFAFFEKNGAIVQVCVITRSNEVTKDDVKAFGVNYLLVIGCGWRIPAISPPH
jgi:hypothetical protein